MVQREILLLRTIPNSTSHVGAGLAFPGSLTWLHTTARAPSASSFALAFAGFGAYSTGLLFGVEGLEGLGFVEFRSSIGSMMASKALFKGLMFANSLKILYDTCWPESPVASRGSHWHAC